MSAFLVPHVQNVVATCTCGTALYLPGLVHTLRYAEYNPKRFSAVSIRLRVPRATALVFSSGRIVCTGAKSALEARWALFKFIALLRTRCHLPAHLYAFRIQNMVASVDMGFPLDLDRCRRTYPRYASYDPALFPGLIYRTHATHGVVVLMFASGRLVLTGAKCVEALYRAFDALVPTLWAIAASLTVPSSPSATTPTISPMPIATTSSTDDLAEAEALVASLVREDASISGGTVAP